MGRTDCSLLEVHSASAGRIISVSPASKGAWVANCGRACWTSIRPRLLSLRLIALGAPARLSRNATLSASVPHQAGAPPLLGILRRSLPMRLVLEHQLISARDRTFLSTPCPAGLGSPCAPPPGATTAAPRQLEQNENKHGHERQDTRCGWVPCLSNFLPGYQGGASWRGAFLASVTTDVSERIPGQRPMARRVLSVQSQHPLNAGARGWFPRNLPFFFAR